MSGVKLMQGYQAKQTYGEKAVDAWPKSVPYELLSEEWAQKNHCQSLATLSSRGGLCPSEMLANIERRRWTRIDENEAALKIAALINSSAIKSAKERLATSARALYDKHIDGIREAAKQCGYAIGAHGSIARDIDLIAVPWAEDAKTTTELLSAILAVIAPSGGYLPSDDWVSHKPHGRLAFPFYFPGDPHQPYIDLSVMPLETGTQPDMEIRKWWDANESGRIECGSNKIQMEKA